jgi:hypothetical protein
MPSPLDEDDFNNPMCVMWAVLALHALHRYTPTEDTTSTIAIDYRALVNDTFELFVSRFYEGLWPGFSHYSAITRLQQYSRVHHNSTLRTNQFTIDPLFCCSLLVAFDDQVRIRPTHQGPWSNLGMETAIVDFMRERLDEFLKASLRMINRTPVDMRRTDSQIIFIKGSLTGPICTIIEHYIEGKLDMHVFNDYTLPANCGTDMLNVSHEALLRYVDNLVDALLDNTGIEQGTYIADNLEPALEVLYKGLADFFLPRSPLLTPLRDVLADLPNDDNDDDDDDDDADDSFDDETYGDYLNSDDDSIGGIDDAQNNDIDWFHAEFHDMLTGPANAMIGDVSIPFDYEFDGSPCGICGDEDVPMRELVHCGHDVCEECLVRQLKTDHQCRYKCAFCRGYLF